MKKQRVFTAALTVIILGTSAAMTLPAVQAAPASVSSQTTSHAEAVYQGALPLLASGKLPQAIQYLNGNIYAVGSYRATVLALKLENLHKALLPAWQDKFSSQTVQRKLTAIYKPGISMSGLTSAASDPALQSLLKSAAESGYKIETAEGSFFPVIDYAAYRKYKLYVTADIRDYISIMAAESDLPPAKDNGLIISWADVTARTLIQEKFTLNYPKSNRYAAVKALYQNYVLNTFYGLNNTPLFHYDNLEMDLEAQKAYAGILAKYPDSDSPFLKKLDGLMKLLKENGYKQDDAVLQYLKEQVPLSQK